MKAVPPDSAHREAWLVLEVRDLGWVPDLYQSVLEQLKAKILIFRRLVLGEGVVHVKAIELDLLQREGTVDKDPANKMLPKLILKVA